MYIISLSCIIYTYCKLILKSPSGRINKSIVLYCIVSSCPGKRKVHSIFPHNMTDIQNVI